MTRLAFNNNHSLTNLEKMTTNGWSVHLECRRSWFRTRVGSNQTIGICFFSAKHAEFRSKSKNWLARNQDNVSECGNMSTCILLFH